MSTIVLTYGSGVTCSVLYSKATTNVDASNILEKIDNSREIECIIGCKSFIGCSFASFAMVDKEKYIGSCSYYASLSLESGSNITEITAYISKYILCDITGETYDVYPHYSQG